MQQLWALPSQHVAVLWLWPPAFASVNLGKIQQKKILLGK